MSMIEIKPDTEAKLKVLAQTSGLSIDELLVSLVSGASQVPAFPTTVNPPANHDPLTEFQAWVKKFSTTGPDLSDEVVSRESIYER